MILKHLNKILVGIAIGGLLVTNIILIDKFNSLQMNLNAYYNQAHTLGAQVSGLQAEFSSWNQSEKLINMHYYDIKSSKDFENAKITAQITLNKLATNSKVFLMYRDFQVPNQVWQSIQLENQGGLNFTTELELSYEANYETQLFVEGDKEQYSERMDSIHLKDELHQRLDMQVIPMSFDSNGNLTFEVTVLNNYYRGEGLKLKSLDCYIYYEDKLIHQVDVMSKAKRTDWGQEPIENWQYSEKIKVENMNTSNNDYMNYLNMKLIAVDRLGKEYTFDQSGF